MEKTNLQDIANSIIEADSELTTEPKTSPKTTPKQNTTTVVEEPTKVDEPTVIIGDYVDNTKPSEETKSNSNTISAVESDAPVGVPLDLGQLETSSNNTNSFAPNNTGTMIEQVGVVGGEFTTLEEISDEAKEYRKSLILDGFTPEEANEATDKWIKKQKGDHVPAEQPIVVSVEVAKDEENLLQFSDSDKDKIVKAKAINLTIVEDQDLLTIKIDNSFKKDNKASYLKKIEGALSQYSVPLPVLGDYVTFKGAQILQLHSITAKDDQRIEATINASASLIYDKIFSSTILDTVDNKGNQLLSYTDFINKFPYADIQMALYGILCASSSSETETELTCPNCSNKWKQTYSVSNLLKMNSFSDRFKDLTDNILSMRDSQSNIIEIHNENNKIVRCKSPITQNIYEITYPTVGRAMNIFSKIDQEDRVMIYNSSAALFLNKVYIFNALNDSYIEVFAEEISEMLDSLMNIPDEDVALITQQASTLYGYSPEFAIDAKCTGCQKETEIPVSIEDLIFLKARDSIKTTIN